MPRGQGPRRSADEIRQSLLNRRTGAVPPEVRQDAKYVHPTPEPTPPVITPDAILPPEDASDGPGWLARTAPMAIRGITGMGLGKWLLGAAGGAAGSAAAGVGAIPGAAGGAAVGAGLDALIGAGGEGVAQMIEHATGQREDLSPGSMAVEGGISAIPFGRQASALRSLLKGGLVSGAGTAARQQTEEGLHVPTAGDVGEMALGAGIGGGAAGAVTALPRVVRGIQAQRAERLANTPFGPEPPSPGPRFFERGAPPKAEYGPEPPPPAGPLFHRNEDPYGPARPPATGPRFFTKSAPEPPPVAPEPPPVRTESPATDVSATAPAAAPTTPSITSSWFRPRIRVPQEGIQSDSELRVLMREADRGKGDFLPDNAPAADRAAAQQAHRSAAIMDSDYERLIHDERGGIDPKLAVELGLGAGGAMAGATDDENPVGGAVYGGLLGLLGGRMLTRGRQGVDEAAKLQRANMLSGIATPTVNVGGGNLGSLGVEGLTRVLSGDFRGAGQIGKTMLNPMAWGRALRAGKETFQNPESYATTNSTGHTIGRGILDLPTRAIVANDAAFQKLAAEAQVDPALAKAMTYADDPTTPLGSLLARTSNTTLGQFIFPFMKTRVRMAERGLGEYSPLGLVTESGREALSTGGSQAARRLAMAGLGTAAAGAGYAADIDHPAAIALTGPLAPMTMLGGLLNREEEGDSFDVERALAGMGRSMPGVNPLSSAERYIGRLAPNFGRDVAEVIDPEERETPGLFGEATRKTPFLRQFLPAEGGGRPTRAKRATRAKREKREKR